MERHEFKLTWADIEYQRVLEYLDIKRKLALKVLKKASKNEDLDIREQREALQYVMDLIQTQTNKKPAEPAICVGGYEISVGIETMKILGLSIHGDKSIWTKKPKPADVQLMVTEMAKVTDMIWEDKMTIERPGQLIYYLLMKKEALPQFYKSS